MKKPLVSIIIPTYNRAHLIDETLESVLAQTYQNWECIIIDDGSSDNTITVVKKFLEKDSRFQYYQRPTTKLKGPNSCRNYGFELSKGELINWFDSDDILFKNSLALKVSNFAHNTDAVVAKCEIFNSSTGLKISENTILSSGNLIKDYFVGNITYYVSGPIWRRSFLKKQYELFDEKISYLDDWDFNLRMLHQKPNIKFLDVVVFRYRYHTHSLSQRIEHSDIEEFKSECIARNKQLNLISKDSFRNAQIQKFILERHKLFLKEAVKKRDKTTIWFLLKLVSLRLRFSSFKLN